MVWVDIRGDDGQGQALVLLLGNSGPSIAVDVALQGILTDLARDRAR